MRRNDQPSRPNAMTCSRFSLLKTWLMTTEGNFPLRQLCLKPSLYGRFSLDHLWPLLGDHRGPAQLAREREQRRRELEKRKLEITVRHRILAEVLKKVGAPLDRADLVLIASAMLEKTEPLRREALARRHKMVDGSTSEVTFPQVQRGLQRLLRRLDESGLSKLIVEIVLLGSVEETPQGDADTLIAAAKRHRVDVAKVRTTVEAEFAAKLKKAEAKQKQPIKPAKKAAAKAQAAA
jgi:ParB family transcriptional regulator, chromosome partitioning protein